jgi:large subunit ribosomal protein L10
MNKDEKAAQVDEIADRLGDAEAIFAIDYRGISVPQAAELRAQLADADTTFRVVKNRLAKRAAERAGTAELEKLLEGPTALAFVKGDAVTAAKAIATFGRQHQILDYKGGLMDGAPLEPEKFTTIARLPALDVLQGQFVATVASPLTGLARGLGAMLAGLAIALGEIQEKGLVSGEPPAADTAPTSASPPAEGAEGDRSSGEAGRGREAEDSGVDGEAEQPAAEETEDPAAGGEAEGSTVESETEEAEETEEAKDEGSEEE